MNQLPLDESDVVKFFQLFNKATNIGLIQAEKYQSDEFDYITYRDKVFEVVFIEYSKLWKRKKYKFFITWAKFEFIGLCTNAAGNILNDYVIDGRKSQKDQTSMLHDLFHPHFIKSYNREIAIKKLLE